MQTTKIILWSKADFRTIVPKNFHNNYTIWLQTIIIKSLIIHKRNMQLSWYMLIQETQILLQIMFKLKLFRYLKYFVGLEIEKSSKRIRRCQRRYTLQLLIDTCFINAKYVSLPMDPSAIFNDEDGPLHEDVSQYRRKIGRLLYLTISRHDISFAVNKLI